MNLSGEVIHEGSTEKWQFSKSLKDESGLHGLGKPS